MTSIVIAAHNEATVIGQNLRRLLDGAAPDEFEVLVVANGCTDATAEVARSVPGVRVLELVEASKSAALNAGDEAATRFPRIYLDADIALTAAGVRTLAAAVGGDPAGAGPGTGGTTGALLAASPGRILDTSGRPLLVRAYFAVNRRLPAFQDALFGRGAIAVSQAGRARFDRFPGMIADDLFLDSQFVVGEKREIPAVTTVVATPRRTKDLLRRLGRVRAGNSAMRAAEQGVRPARRSSWLFDVVLPRPWLIPAGICYAALTVVAGLSARRTSTQQGWGRDESSRTPAEGASR